MPILVTTEALSPSQVRAKQLAHNAIAVMDDPDMLKQIYDEITDLEARLETGLVDVELDAEQNRVALQDMHTEFNFEVLQIVFLPRDKVAWDRAVEMIQSDASVDVCELGVFEEFAARIRQVGRERNVRNLSAILTQMSVIVQEHYERTDATKRLDTDHRSTDRPPERGDLRR